MISSDTIRQKYLEFFKTKQHAVIPSASLIPENDPTVLFTTAGMHPLVPYLMGEPHPAGNRLVDFQKCIRTQDIDEVGDNWHLTCFEMLGNWSLGDYFKEQSISWSYEFLTDSKWLGLPHEKLCVTCFEGDQDAPKDTQAADIWKKMGFADHKIIFLPKEDNWWGPAGMTGPCGPDTEIFYYTGKGTPAPNSNPRDDKKNWVEIWNNVFMQYEKTKEGKFIPLKAQHVDTGMGLERIVGSVNGFSNVYETDLLAPVMEAVLKVTQKKTPLSENDLRSCRIITDHIRAAVFILGDPRGVVPSNTDQGYILRRLIRRSVRELRKLGMTNNVLAIIAKQVIQRFESIYPELTQNQERVIVELDKEETRFKELLEKGLRHLQSEIKSLQNNQEKTVSAKLAFDMYQSYGFPIEMTTEIVQENQLTVDSNGFQQLYHEHQELSRKGAEQKFKGGLADHSVETTRLHTATHLLNEALRQVVSKDIHQKGSNITAERLRFDFNYSTKLSPEQLKAVEDWVNDKIKQGLDVKMEIMTLEQAQKLGAQSEFGHKYEQNVKVYTIQDAKGNVFSRELCGGPHVSNTKELGHFSISKEEAVAAGVRRIKAIVNG